MADFFIHTKELRDALNVVKAFMSTEETRYYLNGIYCHFKAGELLFVATDGHKLCRKVVPLEAENNPDTGLDETFGVIIPRVTVGLLLKALTAIKPLGAQVRYNTEKPGYIEFDLLDMVITSKLIDGTFPDYERVIPVPAEGDKKVGLWAKNLKPVLAAMPADAAFEWNLRSENDPILMSRKDGTTIAIMPMRL